MKLAFFLAPAATAILAAATGVLAQTPQSEPSTAQAPADQAPADQTPTEQVSKPVSEPGVVHRIPMPARAAEGSATNASVNVTLVTNGPIPDTPENRQRFGKPNSHAGRNTKPAGN